MRCLLERGITQLFTLRRVLRTRHTIRPYLSRYHEHLDERSSIVISNSIYITEGVFNTFLTRHAFIQI